MASDFLFAAFFLAGGLYKGTIKTRLSIRTIKMPILECGSTILILKGMFDGCASL